MAGPCFRRFVFVVFAVALVALTACRPSTNASSEAEVIRASERARLKALVEADIEVARQLHADDFQLINPVGESLSKEQYLAAVESGELDYLKWETEAIEVRMYGEAALIRYQSQLEIVVSGQDLGLRRHWHTDSYEKRNGRWQVVWSQATVIR